MAWQLIVPAALQGLKTMYTAFNKPKAQYPEETMNTINKMIANQQSDIKNKTLMNMLTSSAKSQGAQQYQQAQHSLDILKNKGDLSEGQYAKSLLQAGTDVQGVVGKATERAGMEQYKANQSALDRIDQARLQLAQIKDSVRQQLNTERQQWKNELAGGVLDTATATFNGITQGIADKELQGMVTDYANKINKPYGQWSIEDKQGLMSAVQMQLSGVDINSLTQDMGTTSQSPFTNFDYSNIRQRLDMLKKLNLWGNPNAPMGVM